MSRSKCVTIEIICILFALVFSARAGRTDSKGPARKTTGFQTARLENPRINMRSIRLNDAMDLQTTYPAANELGRRLERGAARPVALASGDFDEDGVPDLLSEYAGPGGGILALHRGNADSIYPNSPEAQQRKARGTFTGAPFLPPEQVFELPEAAELLGTGDFNNDGHLDVVAAAHGSAALQLLSGDGRGKLGGAQRVELPGRVTALVTGEINRPEGLIDVIVGITGPAGPKVLVFESPEGILRGRPEAITLPAEATALALGELDEDFADLAVAAGRDLLIVHGHDRKPGFEEGSQFEVPHAAQSVAGETDPRGMSVSAMTQPRSSLPTGGTPVPSHRKFRRRKVAGSSGAVGGRDGTFTHKGAGARSRESVRVFLRCLHSRTKAIQDRGLATQRAFPSVTERPDAASFFGSRVGLRPPRGRPDPGRSNPSTTAHPCGRDGGSAAG